ncbi:jg23105 [Pararge aegeria aegeria]|uniref:Jg23105 protein n=1 Tax=Pararge aegeria aegeria TaxID=348720 RepID=A0A8S4QQJ0_9NEOP|nr:jg23105 [Pararge aegeria aegeria]
MGGGESADRAVTSRQWHPRAPLFCLELGPVTKCGKYRSITVHRALSGRVWNPSGREYVTLATAFFKQWDRTCVVED